MIYGTHTHTVSIIDDDTLFTVVYDGNGATNGVVPLDGNSYTQGDSVIVLGNNGNLVKSEFSFSGWSTTSDPGTPIHTPGRKFTMGTQGVTLYAKWTTTTYTVTYEGNGNSGGVIPDSQTKSHGAALTLASNTGSLVRTGYTFMGWNTSADGSGTDYPEGASYSIDEDVILFAKWTISEYKVIHSIDDGSEGRSPDFQKLTIEKRGIDIKITIDFYSEADITTAGDHIYMYGVNRHKVGFDRNKFELRLDKQGDGHFETLLQSGAVNRTGNTQLQITILASNIPDIEEKKVWGYSMTSQDRIPDN